MSPISRAVCLVSVFALAGCGPPAVNISVDPDTVASLRFTYDFAPDVCVTDRDLVAKCVTELNGLPSRPPQRKAGVEDAAGLEVVGQEGEVIATYAFPSPFLVEVTPRDGGTRLIAYRQMPTVGRVFALVLIRRSLADLAEVAQRTAWDADDQKRAKRLVRRMGLLYPRGAFAEPEGPAQLAPICRTLDGLSLDDLDAFADYLEISNKWWQL